MIVFYSTVFFPLELVIVLCSNGIVLFIPHISKYPMHKGRNNSDFQKGSLICKGCSLDKVTCYLLVESQPAGYHFKESDLSFTILDFVPGSSRLKPLFLTSPSPMELRCQMTFLISCQLLSVCGFFFQFLLK